MFYKPTKTVISGAILLLTAISYGITPLTTPPAPYENHSVAVSQHTPVIKEEPATTTHWKNKTNYMKAGFYVGNKSLNVKEALRALKIDSDNILYIVINNRIAATFQMWGSTKGGYGHPFALVKGSKPQLKVDYKHKSFSWRKEFYLNKTRTETAYFRYIAALQPNGLIKLTWQVEATDALWKKYRSDYAMFVNFRDFFTQKIAMNGKTCNFIPAANLKPKQKYLIWRGRCDKFIYNPDNIANGFALSIPGQQKGFIKESLDWRKQPSAYLRINPARNAKSLTLLLDLRMVTAASTKPSSDIQAGIDFWKCDRLHVPNYRKSINLIQNPSFEEGLRYYTLMVTWAKYHKRAKPVFEVSPSNAKYGNHALQINLLPNAPNSGYLKTFAIPVIKGQKYTLSFYAKANKKVSLNLRCVTGVWLQFPKLNGGTVGTEWQRYTSTFTAPNRVVTILFGGRYYGSDPEGAALFIDGVQLEAGTKASNYVDQPISARLLTSNKDNFLGEQDAVDARLKIIGPPNAKGEVQIKVKNFFAIPVWQRNIAFKTDNRGEALIKLPLDKIIKNGIYVIRGDITFANGKKLTDFFRISRMKFLTNTHRNKNITATVVPIRSSRAEDIIKRCQQIGFGSTNYYREQADYILFKKYGIEVTSYPAASEKKLADGTTIYQLRSFTNPNEVYVKDLTNITTVTPTIEQQIKDAAYRLAKANPWIKFWHLAGEMNAGGYKKFGLLREKKWAEFGKILIAFYRGIKKYDTTKIVLLTGGPSNMNPQYGTKFLENILKGINDKVKFDAVAIHPYRATPCDPDLDHDAGIFFAMLKRNGYAGIPTYWNEGIYYTYYNIPAWGLNPFRGCSTDHYRAYCPSYDMGWGERISAAYFARSWLVALKYQDYLKQFNGWSSWMYMDAYLTPLALQKIPNTLGNLLGNAYFKQDIRFAPHVRCYIFENEHQQPVAALWSNFNRVDHGLQHAPTAAFNFNGTLKTIYDLMENEHTADKKEGKVLLPVSPFPIFMVGKRGTLAAFSAAIQAGQLINATALPITISGTPLNRTQVEVTCKNHLTKDFKGQLKIGKVSQPLLIKSTASKSMVSSLTAPVRFDRINSFAIPVELTFGQQQTIKKKIKFDAFAIHHLTKSPDWAKLPTIRLQNRTLVKFTGSTTQVAVHHHKKVGIPGDFAASFKVAWDDNAFYLRVTVVDDKLCTIPKNRPVSDGWKYDSLQLYFDTFCDARTHQGRGFDSNDYNYNIVPVSPNRAVVYRSTTPEQQIAGGLDAPRPNMVEPGVKCSFTKTANGYVYELIFPKHLLAPMRFARNAKVGFGIYLNDNDDQGLRSALTLTPPGTGCYMKPHLYPVMLLEK